MGQALPSSEADDPRRELLIGWLSSLPPDLGLQPKSLRGASSDASFRRYFRVDAGGDAASSWIVMDAPPALEDCRPYVQVAGLLTGQGVSAPGIQASDLSQGFLLLSDFGHTTYADALAQGAPDAATLYGDALATLVRMQSIACADCLPPYDRARLLAEMQLFPDWYVERHLGIALENTERETLKSAFDLLTARALAQTQVFVHRDYHCRNLMVLARNNPGVLDFQDAVVGPVTYDLVSLLRDAYVEWPEARQIDWAAHYWELARRAGIGVAPAFDEFWLDLEWMGLQRSLKILGIFARLCHRDGKQRYLQDLPLVLRHTRLVAERYDAFGGLAHLLDRIHGQTRRSGFTF